MSDTDKDAANFVNCKYQIPVEWKTYKIVMIKDICHSLLDAWFTFSGCHSHLTYIEFYTTAISEWSFTKNRLQKLIQMSLNTSFSQLNSSLMELYCIQEVYCIQIKRLILLLNGLVSIQTQTVLNAMIFIWIIFFTNFTTKARLFFFLEIFT